MVYFGGGTHVHALNAETGAEEWTFETGQNISSSPHAVNRTVYNDGTESVVRTVFIGSTDGTLYALNANTGELAWRFETGEAVYSSPVVTEGTVFFGSTDGNLYALSAGSGEQRWAAYFGDRIYASPTVVGGTVYVTCYDNNVYAVNAGSGREQWSFETGDRILSSPTVFDGTVYVGSSDESLYALDAADGTQEWTLGADGRLVTTPTARGDLVFAGSGAGSVYALNASTGEREWVFDAGRPANSSPTIAGDTVFFGADDALYAVEMATGEQRWTSTIGDVGFASPTVTAGTVYMGGGSTMYAFNTNADSSSDGSRVLLGTLGHTDQVEAGARLPIPTESPTPTETPTSTETSTPAETPTETPTETPRLTTTPPGGSQQVLTGVPDEAVGGGVLALLTGVMYGVFSRKGRGDTTDGRSGGSGPADGGKPQEAATSETAFEQTTAEQAPGGAGVEAGAASLGESISSEEQLPSAETVTSPPRRVALSQEDLTVVEEVGAGGQAIVNKARLPGDKQPPATVALREPDRKETLTQEAVEEFLEQAETWATIDARERQKPRWEGYEHIVGVIATGDRQPWLAMEYMDGGDVAELLTEHPDGLPVGQALWVGECVCKGLEIAHQLGRAHLDVKPENVLLKETDGWPWPKLADWGLARTLAEETGTVEGLSVEYAGPEQFDSGEFGDPDQLTDIYQSGALVYALLTGGPPVTGSPTEVVGTVLGSGSITPPSERRSELPAAVDAAVGLALEREKTERYSSISTFGDALHAIRTGERLPRDVAARLDR